jgi:hypothetical protein
MRVLPPLLAALLISFVIACGSDAPTRDFSDTARAVAPTVLLQAEDLPGWSPSTQGFAAVDVRFTPECDVLDPDRLFGNAVATAESAVFEGPDDRLALSLAAVYETGEDASGSLAAVNAMVERCRDEYLETLDTLARGALSDRGLSMGPLSRINVSLEPLSFTAESEESLGYRAQVRVSVVGLESTYALDVLLMRQGRVVATLVYAGFTPFDADRTAVTEVIATRLSAAEAALQ